MLKLLEQLVNIDSGSHTKKGIDNIGEILKKRYEQLGFVVEIVKRNDYGNHLVIQHKETIDPKIIIIAHMDTVFPEGTAKTRPFTIKGTRAYGPGIIDMKASLVTLLYALAAMKQVGYKGYRNVQIILNSDEEIGSPSSKAIIMKEAVGKKYALIMESARPDGSLVTSRRGCGRYEIVVEGKAAHAGIEAGKGKSAIIELAHKIIELENLTNDEEGIHINVGYVQGGTTANTVPAQAKALVDIRFTQKKQWKHLLERMEQVCRKTYIKGTKTSLSGAISRMPMEKTKQTETLLAFIQTVGKDLGISITDTSTGGGSDAAFTSAMGIPTIDGLGPVGGEFHSEEEYVELDSLIERTLLLATVIQTLSKE